LKYFF